MRAVATCGCGTASTPPRASVPAREAEDRYSCMQRDWKPIDRLREGRLPYAVDQPIAGEEGRARLVNTSA